VRLASALRGSGDLGGCREALRDALDLIPPEGVAERARLEAACATVEAWLGRPDDARRRLIRTREAMGHQRSPEAVVLEVRLALDALNELEFDRGAEMAGAALLSARALEEPALVAAFREAERDFDAMGALRARDAVRRELRKLGARIEARGPASAAETGLEALSPREREIVELVADRRTNREIAAALFLSEKTVESHLRNVFRKLSASSRVQVARAVEQEREAKRERP
jgi:DNA-binding CsgD family transcriptional regulator